MRIPSYFAFSQQTILKTPVPAQMLADTGVSLVTSGSKGLDGRDSEVQNRLFYFSVTSRWACEPCCPTRPTSRHNSEHCPSPRGTSEQTMCGQPAHQRGSTELPQKPNAGRHKSFPILQRGGTWHWDTSLRPT